MVIGSGDGAADRALIRRLVASPPGVVENLVDLLDRVCRVTARELSASGVGISMMADGGVRGLSVASDAVSERCEHLQFTLGEGPCIEAFGARRPVLIANLAEPGWIRWPVYASVVHEDGIRAVFAFPLQVGAARLGVMDVFRQRAGPLTEAELRAALLFADVTVEALLDRQADLGGRGDPGGLVLDVGNRAQLFQAQGMVMVQLGITLDEAMMRMRAHAFATNRRLDDVARDIVGRRLTLDQDAT